MLKVKTLVAQSCLTLCNTMNCSPPGSSVHGIFQARKLEWVAIPFSRGSSPPGDWTQVSWSSCIAGGFFTIWATKLMIRHKSASYTLIRYMHKLLWLNPDWFSTQRRGPGPPPGRVAQCFQGHMNSQPDCHQQAIIYAFLSGEMETPEPSYS